MNRYFFLKKFYPLTILIFWKKNNYVVYLDDFKIIRFLKIGNIIKELDYYHINYLIVDDLEIVSIKSFNDNRYLEFMYKVIVFDIYLLLLNYVY